MLLGSRCMPGRHGVATGEHTIADPTSSGTATPGKTHGRERFRAIDARHLAPRLQMRQEFLVAVYHIVQQSLAQRLEMLTNRGQLTRRLTLLQNRVGKAQKLAVIRHVALDAIELDVTHPL